MTINCSVKMIFFIDFLISFLFVAFDFDDRLQLFSFLEKEFVS